MSMDVREESSSSSSDNGIGIPDDLVIEILSRLPPERAFECRCLSKFYYGVIGSGDFIRKNYDLSIQTTPSVVLRRRGLLRTTNFLVDFDATIVHRLTKPYKAELLGCCRGIICYNIPVPRIRYCHSIRLAFWNPFTGAYRRSLAEDVSPAGCPEWEWEYKCPSSWIFLGYDAVTDDLKVLKIMKYVEPGESVDSTVYEFAVYSSKVDSWKMVELGLQQKLYFCPVVMGTSDNDHVFLEGTNCVHMFASLGFDTRVILCFDFASEKFSILSVPEHWRKDDTWSMRPISEDRPWLSSLNGCLCMYNKPCYDSLDVWMMKWHGDEESWARVFSLKACGRSLNLIPLTLRNNGRQLLLLSSKHKLTIFPCKVEEEELIFPCNEEEEEEFNFPCNVEEEEEQQQVEKMKEVLREAITLRRLGFLDSFRQPVKKPCMDHSTHPFLFVASLRQP